MHHLHYEHRCKPIVVIRIHIVVKLKWPITVNVKIEKLKNISTMTTGNPNLPSPYPTNNGYVHWLS